MAGPRGKGREGIVEHQLTSGVTLTSVEFERASFYESFCL